MIKHIKSLWNDAEELKEIGKNEFFILQNYTDRIEKPTLIKYNDRTYIAGWDTHDIVIIDHQVDTNPLLRLSGNLKKI